DVVVRFARDGETLTLLNGDVLALAPDLLLVADAKKPLGLAGIMGGEHSGIGDDTTDVLLEGAFWNPDAIQGRMRRLGFQSDAGYRFERGVDAALGPVAVERATALIVELCGGRAGPLTDVKGALPARDPVRVRPARVAVTATTSSSRRRRTASTSRSRRTSSRRSRAFTATRRSPRPSAAMREACSPLPKRGARRTTCARRSPR